MDPYHAPDAEARLAAVAEAAAEVGAAPNQVVLAWLMRSAPALVPLIGPRTFDQYETAMASLDIKLSEEQPARLDAAGA